MGAGDVLGGSDTLGMEVGGDDGVGRDEMLGKEEKDGRSGWRRRMEKRMVTSLRMTEYYSHRIQGSLLSSTMYKHQNLDYGSSYCLQGQHRDTLPVSHSNHTPTPIFFATSESHLTHSTPWSIMLMVPL